MKTVGVVPFVLAATLLRAADLPGPDLPQGVGVNIHFTRGHARDLDLIRDAGIRVVRMDFVWASIEQERGQYDWSAYEELTANLTQRGLRPYYILDYSNPLYEAAVVTKNPVTGREQRDIASPQQPQSVAAFAAWAAAAAKHFEGRDIIWEIWNEPNITFWKPKPDVRQYLALAEATARSIRAAAPSATIVAPATSEVPVPFLEALFRSEVLPLLDAISVHPYRNYRKSPETAGEDYARVRELLARLAPEGKKRLPILSGEWGYASHTRGVPLEKQAAFAARMQLANCYYRIPVSIWYDWVNDGPDPAEREHNFGLVDSGRQPKPAYRAIRTLTRELDGFRMARRLDLGHAADWVLLFTDDAGRRRAALWTTGSPHRATIPGLGPRPEALQATDSQGQAVAVGWENEGLTLEVEAAPRYVRM